MIAITDLAVYFAEIIFICLDGFDQVENNTACSTVLEESAGNGFLGFVSSLYSGSLRNGLMFHSSSLLLKCLLSSTGQRKLL